MSPKISDLLNELSRVAITVPEGMNSRIAEALIGSHANSFDGLLRPVQGWGSDQDPVTEVMLRDAEGHLQRLLAENAHPQVEALAPLNTLLRNIFAAKKAVLDRMRRRLGQGDPAVESGA